MRAMAEVYAGGRAHSKGAGKLTHLASVSHRESPAAAPAPAEHVLPEPIPIKQVVRRAAPRLLRDGFGPLVLFFLGWKLIGLYAGVGMAVLFGVAGFVHERRGGGPPACAGVAAGAGWGSERSLGSLRAARRCISRRRSASTRSSASLCCPRWPVSVPSPRGSLRR